VSILQLQTNDSTYRINNNTIKKVKSTKYLGVINCNLSWSDHIISICNKARSTLAFVQRNLKQCSSTLRIQAYLSYVRPIIEYASTVWSPHNMCDIQKLEMIQHRAARFVYNDYSQYTSVTSLINRLQWTTLQQRRDINKLITFYKMLNGLISLEFLNTLQPNTSCTREHDLKYR